MKAVKTLSIQISKQQAEIARIEAEVVRLDAVVSSADQGASALADLRKRRAEEAARAFVEKRASDTKKLDAEISSAEEAGNEARAAADAASISVGILKQRADELREELDFMDKKRRGEAIGQLQRVREDAIDEYVAAVNSIGPIIARMKAADALIRLVNPSDANPAVLPGEALFNRVKLERMPIPWTHTDRPQPQNTGGGHFIPADVAYALTVNKRYVPVLAEPDWMRSDDFIEPAMTAEVSRLREAGMEI